MSNTDNIYNILNNFNKIAKEAPAPVAAAPKVKTKLQESMEQVVNEKYMGFKKTVAAGKKLGEQQDMMKNFFVILDDSLIDQIANMDGAEVDPDAGTVETWNENTARQLAVFAQKNPNRLQRKQSMNTAGMKPMAQRADGSSTGPEYGLKEDKKLNEKAANPYAVGMAVAKKKAGITAKSAHDLPKKVVKKAQEIAKKIDEEEKGRIKDKYLTKEDHGPENPDALVNYGEYDREGDMAKDDLYTIDNAAEELYSILRTDDNLPEWVQKKITLAVDYLDTARDYMKAQSYGQGVAEELDPEHVEYLKRQADVSRSTGLAVGDRVTLKNKPGFEGEIVHDWGGGDFTISGSGGGMSQSNNHRANARILQKIQGVAEGAGNPDIQPGMKVSQGTVVKVDGNTVTVKTSNGDMMTMNIHDIDQAVAEASFPTVADARKRAEQEKGTGKFTSKPNPDNPSGTIYTRKYNPKSGETDDTENVSTEKRGRGRPKKSAFEDMSTIDKMIAEAFGQLGERITINPDGTTSGRVAPPPLPGVGSGIRVAPMPATTTPKPATGMGTIKGGVFSADPPKPGEQGVAIPQGLDEVDAEMEGMRKLAGLKGGQKKLDRDQDGELTAKDFSMLRKGLEEGGASMPGDQYLSIPADQTKLSLGQRMARDGIAYSGDNEREMIGIIAKYMKDQGESLSTIRYYMNDDDFVADALSDLRAASSQKPDYKSKMQAKFGGSAEDLTRGLSIQSKKVEEGGRDDYDEIRDKIQWLQGAPNYLSRDEAIETAYYTKETDPVWDGYRDDADEVGENLEVRANPAGASSAEQAKKIGAQFPQQNGKEPNLAYKIGEDDMEVDEQLNPALSTPTIDKIVANKAAAVKRGDASAKDDYDKSFVGAYSQDEQGQKKYSARTTPGVINKIKDTFGLDKPDSAYGPKAAEPTQSTNEDDMEEGNVITKAMADKNIPVGAPIPGTNLKKTKHLDTMAEDDVALNQMRRIAGLKEGGMSPISGMASDMQKQQGSMNISTNQSSDGTKSVTITAAGDAASDLMQMLKLAGMGSGAAALTQTEPEIVLVQQDSEAAMEEEKDPRYQASTTPDEQVAPIQALTKGGNGDVAGQEKKMKPGGYQFGDNNLAMQESLSVQLMKEYNSIKVKK